MLFVADKGAWKMTIFLGSSLALVLSSAIGVAMGGLISQYVSPKALSIIAGTGFILIGTLTLINSFKTS
jgi:putative Ca2+/H+ antiporter (TMEM165/GDT1 family)